MNGSSSFSIKISEKNKTKNFEILLLGPDPNPFFFSADPGSGSASKLIGSLALIETNSY